MCPVTKVPAGDMLLWRMVKKYGTDWLPMRRPASREELCQTKVVLYSIGEAWQLQKEGRPDSEQESESELEPEEETQPTGAGASEAGGLLQEGGQLSGLLDPFNQVRAPGPV